MNRPNAREKILEAADALFSEIGFDGTTVRKIAEVSGTNKALIHYHFKSKEGLFDQVLDVYFKELSDTLHGALLLEGTLQERLAVLFERYMNFLERNRNFTPIVHRELNGGRHMDRIIDHMVPLFQFTLKAIQVSSSPSRTADLSAEHLLISGYGMIITYFTCSGIVERLFDGNPLSDENLQSRNRHIRKMLEIILKGVNESPAAGDHTAS
jgi:AcrR family transcriptional regulator